jgi:hypothetical protein
VRDIFDLVWAAFRLRRLKAWLMTAGARSALIRQLSPPDGNRGDTLPISTPRREIHR